MTWRNITCYELVCDRCGITYDDEDVCTIHFGPEPSIPSFYDWHTVTGDAGEKHYCEECFDTIQQDAADAATDGATAPEADPAPAEATDPNRWDQTGVDLLGVDRDAPPVQRCCLCHRERGLQDTFDYHPLQMLTGAPLGWYAGDYGDLCPECCTATLRTKR